MATVGAPAVYHHMVYRRHLLGILTQLTQSGQVCQMYLWYSRGRLSEVLQFIDLDCTCLVDEVNWSQDRHQSTTSTGGLPHSLQTTGLLFCGMALHLADHCAPPAQQQGGGC